MSYTMEKGEIVRELETSGGYVHGECPDPERQYKIKSQKLEEGGLVNIWGPV